MIIKINVNWTCMAGCTIPSGSEPLVMVPPVPSVPLVPPVPFIQDILTELALIRSHLETEEMFICSPSLYAGQLFTPIVQHLQVNKCRNNYYTLKREVGMADCEE